METNDLLFSLLRHVVCGKELNTETAQACTPDTLAAVYDLANHHDLAHMVAHAIEGLSIPECEVLAKLKKAKMVAIYRYTRLDYEFTRICGALENAKIPFIPLKGSVLRQYYPEPWMRTSSDIDVLVKPEDLDRATELFLETLQYRRDGSSSRDISLFSPAGTHVELHFDTVEDYVFKASRIILDQVWETSVPQSGKTYFRQMPDEMFYFYHIAHMAKHILAGGCGIRSFLDIWVMDHCMPENQAARTTLLRQGGLWKFAQTSCKLTQHWFSEAALDEDAQALQHYILQGGTYGNLSNKVALSQARTGGKLNNFIKRVLPPFELLKARYPVLERKPWLLPFCHIRRWYETLRGSKFQRSLRELKLNRNSSIQEQQDAEKLLDSIGLYRSKGEI